LSPGWAFLRLSQLSSPEPPAETDRLKIASASGCERQPKMAEMVAATMLMANSHEKASTKRSILELILLQANEHSTTQYKSSGACATSVINLRLKFSQR